jgi:hypothetical protein
LMLVDKTFGILGYLYGYYTSGLESSLALSDDCATLRFIRGFFVMRGGPSRI